MEQVIKFDTAVLAKEKGFDWDSLRFKSPIDDNSKEYKNWNSYNNALSKPTQEVLKKFIREKRGVHIEIHRNASGYYWSMCRSDGGTDLGWSGLCGPNMGGAWDEYEDAFEHALQTQLSYDLPKDKTLIKHWGNYVDYALKRVP